MGSLEFESARIQWDSDQYPVTASQFTLFALGSDETAVADGALLPHVRRSRRMNVLC